MEPVTSRAGQREALRQTEVRAANERVSAAALRDAQPTDVLDLCCECGDPDCDATLCATHAEYEAVRGIGTRFLIVDTHENPEISVIVSTTEAFSVVDTIGREARRIALAHNPR